MAENDIYRKRLLNVALALRDDYERRKKLPVEAVANDSFDMEYYFRPCGSPACALGSYALRQDLQSEFTMRNNWIDLAAGVTDLFCYSSPEVLRHFGINDEEASLLFSSDGCDGADNEIEAAEFIEAFAREKFG